ncbi:MAG TPA: hypothetical protein P5567_03900 [Kiritimatiellia bacterium]|nr:hypothetical protein [Kiritimatiellia bacterium]HRZ11580.1 hypothetical protein [Kiritimatiellia bacterium]HSA16869.1 hypothetical protein [Kiritimatiellia bacterium]
MSTWTRSGLWFLAAAVALSLATPSLAGWPAPDQMKDIRSIAEQLVKWSNKLKEEYQGKWPGDQDFLNRAGRFCNRCQHLVNIVNVAIDKGEGGRHTQSAYGEVREAWRAVYTASGAGHTDDWKERKEINKLMDRLAPYYQ